MYTPVHPSFTIQKWGLRGYSLHGLVFVMVFSYRLDTNRPVQSHVSKNSIIIYKKVQVLHYFDNADPTLWLQRMICDFVIRIR